MSDNSSDYSMESMSPTEIAKKIFQEEPGDPCSKCILSQSEQWDTDATSFNFEILFK